MNKEEECECHDCAGESVILLTEDCGKIEHCIFCGSTNIAIL